MPSGSWSAPAIRSKKNQAWQKGNAAKKSLRALVDGRPRMVVTDIEKKLGTRYSADTIRVLRSGMPKTEFIWLMGADNLRSFHLWQEWQTIARTLPIAVFDRPGYSVSGLNSKFARQFANFRVSPSRLIKASAPAWTFVQMPRHSGSATSIRRHKGNKWWR